MGGAGETPGVTTDVDRAGSRGGKRDVRGLRVAQQPAEAASSAASSATSSASPSGSRRTWSVYMPVKLQDLAQIREQPGGYIHHSQEPLFSRSCKQC